MHAQDNPFLLLADPAAVLAAAERLDRATAARTRRGGFWARTPMPDTVASSAWRDDDADEDGLVVFEVVGPDLRALPPDSPLMRQVRRR